VIYEIKNCSCNSK